jgi:hypothetical protein
MLGRCTSQCPHEDGLRILYGMLPGVNGWYIEEWRGEAKDGVVDKVRVSDNISTGEEDMKLE